MRQRRTTSRWNSGGGQPRRSQNFRGQRSGRFNRSQIDISAFIAKAKLDTGREKTEETAGRKFRELNLANDLARNIARLGFEQMTPIQEKVFDHIVGGRDVVGIANTGTGKTGAFLIPLINKLSQNPNQKLLVLAPTRELAVQIEATFRDLTQGMRIFSALCIGGTNLGRQMKALTRNPQVVIGTPGRVKDMAQRGCLNLSRFNLVVLDEVDRMLDMGFVHDIGQILTLTAKPRQSLYFSATLPTKVTQLIRTFSREVIHVSVKVNETLSLVDQNVIRFHDQNKKLDTLQDILAGKGVSKVLIFGRTKHGVKKLAFALRDRGFRTDSIHGNKSQSQRQRALGDFRSNRVTILVATDVAARGLDIDDVSHVINYEIPESYDDYVHRIGRTGRMGKKGVAYTFVE